MSDYLITDNKEHTDLETAIKNLSQSELWDSLASIRDLLYPVGTVYLSTKNNSPASFFGGNWNPISAGYALWTATSGGGGTITAGLPDIQGSFTHSSVNYSLSRSGAFKVTESYTSNANSGGSWSGGTREIFKASEYNSIYGNASTVQPPAFKVYAWQRVAD